MSEKQNDILAEFAAFLNERSKKDKGDADEIEYVEVFDGSGRGARVPAWRAHNYLESLGIDVSGCESDASPNDSDSDSDDDDNDVHLTKPPVGRQSRHVTDRLTNDNGGA